MTREFQPPVTIGEKTDVFGIGYVVWCLIVNLISEDGPLREDDVNADVQTRTDRAPQVRTYCVPEPRAKY